MLWLGLGPSCQEHAIITIRKSLKLGQHANCTRSMQCLLGLCDASRLSGTDLLSSAVGGDVRLAGLSNAVVEAVVLLHALPALLHLRAAGLPKVGLRQRLLQALEHPALACAHADSCQLPADLQPVHTMQHAMRDNHMQPGAWCSLMWYDIAWDALNARLCSMVA